MQHRTERSTHDMLRVCSARQLREDGVMTVSGPSGRIAVFSEDGNVYAVDNRCPTWAFRSTAAPSGTGS